MQLLCSESLIHRGLARAAAFSTVEGGAATFAFRAFKTGELQPPSWDISEHLGRAWGGKIRPVRQRSVERRRRPASGRPPVAASRDPMQPRPLEMPASTVDHHRIPTIHVCTILESLKAWRAICDSLTLSYSSGPTQKEI